jgi:hypothetical protein
MFSRLTKSLGFLAIVLAAALAIPQFTFAQSDRDDDDPPSRAARLSFTGGAVSFQPAGTDDWVTVVNNRPITTGDKLWTDRDGRAELRFGSTAVRLGGETGFSFLNLDDRTAQIRLTEGTVNVRVKRLDDDEAIEIDTPNLAFTVLRPGSYRVTVNEAGDTTFIKVRGGDGEVTGGGSSYAVHANQTATFTGTDDLNADVQNYSDDDDFDRWCGDRDRRWDRSTSSRYVSDDVVGYEDLDEYGGWRPTPEYGTVWFPHTTVVGWAPYRYGHWAYIAPWGWTWVDDAPWGFAPFHYGRWVTVGGVWGWVPVAPRPAYVTVGYVRPVYAPAMVAWVGGAHWGVGVSVGGPPAVGVAWFPLGPRDVYCPSYHVGPRYVERVNVSNTTIINRTQVTNVYNNVYVNKTVNVTNITYQNQHINNAVSATSQANFTSAQPVHSHMMRVDERDLSAGVAPTGPSVVPQQRSVLGAGGEARGRPTTAFSARPVVAKTTPPPAPVPFARQQQAIQANGGRPISVAQERQMEPQNTRSNVRIAPPARTVTPQSDRRNAVENRPNQPNQVNPPVNANPPNQGNPSNRPNQPPAQSNPNRPATVTNDTIQQNGQRQNPGPPNANQNNPNSRVNNDRPPSARQQVNPPVNPQLDQKHQQQTENLRQQQDRERQRVEQQQVQQQQKIQQQSNERNQQQVQQRQQKQLENLEQKHGQQQQKLEQKQQKEEQKPRSESKPAKEPKNNDKPPHR